MKLGNSVSKRQDQIDNEDKLDFLFDDYIDYYPNDLAYLTDAVKKTFPASTHSQTSVNQDSYPAASSSNCKTGMLAFVLLLDDCGFHSWNYIQL